MQPLDLIRAKPWERSLFTTFALSLSFFEAVVMDAFVRGGGKDPLILADTLGVQHALSEAGARLVGREYELLPAYQSAGFFHAKISAFLDRDDAHLLIGSGNLTFGGWGGNAEIIEHFHIGNAPGLFSDLAVLLELWATGGSIQVASPERLLSFAEALRSRTRGRTDDGSLKLLHNTGQTVAEQLAEEAEKLGGAERICFAAPFYDRTGKGIRELAASLKCEDVWGYVHTSGEVHGIGSSNWPHDAPQGIKPAQISYPLYGDKRRLHAKAIEVLCRTGRLVISGSSNATHAGLFGPNSEAGVLRIFNDRSGAWALSPCLAPVGTIHDEVDSDEGEVNTRRVLSAELQGATIAGVVMGNWPVGASDLTCEVAGELIDLGRVDVSQEGEFSLRSDEIANKAWQMGRLVLLLKCEGLHAQGFLSVKAVSDLAKRAGSAGARILAILSGTETPADIAAIISWFYEDLERIPMVDLRGGGTQDNRASLDQVVPASAFEASMSLQFNDVIAGAREAGYSYAMRALLEAFRSIRGPINEEAQAAGDTGKLSEDEEDDVVRSERHNEQTLRSFDQLLSIALHSDNLGRHCETMLALTQYMADRLRPTAEQVLRWVDRIQRGVRGKVEGEFAADIVAACILQVAHKPSEQQSLMVRRFLRRHKLISAFQEADFDRLGAMASVVPLEIPLKEAKERIVETRTCGEELETLLATPPEAVLPSLPALEQHSLWSRIRQLHSDSDMRERLIKVSAPVTVCPRCSIVMASSAAEDLRLLEISRCTSRCNRLIAVLGEPEWT